MRGDGVVDAGVDAAHHHGDQRESLNALKKAKGNLALAPRLINARNMTFMKIFDIVHSATHSWYGWRSTSIKAPHKGARMQAALAEGAWQDELVMSVNQSLMDSTNLESLGLVPGGIESDSNIVAAVFDTMMCLLSARAQSQMPESSNYPERFALMMSPRAAVRRVAVTEYAADWRVLMEIEALVHECQPLRDVYISIGWARRSLVRLIFMFFERSGWVEASNATYLIKGLNFRFRDEKLVEDVHAHLGELQRASRSEVTSRDQRWYHCVRKQVLQQRGIPSVQVANAAIAEASAKVYRQQSRGYLSTRIVKLPKAVSKIMDPKVAFYSPKPESIIHSVAAWAWMKEYHANH